MNYGSSIFFSSKVFLLLKSEYLTSQAEPNSYISLRIFIFSIMSIIISVVLSLLMHATQAHLFLSYASLALSVLLCSAILISWQLNFDNQFILNILSSGVQFIICVHILLFTEIVESYKYESQPLYSEKIIHSLFLIEVAYKLGFLILVENYFLNFAIANLLYLILISIAESFVHFYGGGLNILFHLLLSIIFSALIYLFNLARLSMICQSYIISKYLSKNVGTIKVKAKTRSVEIDSFFLKYMKEKNLHSYINRKSSSSIVQHDDVIETESKFLRQDLRRFRPSKFGVDFESNLTVKSIKAYDDSRVLNNLLFHSRFDCFWAKNIDKLMAKFKIKNLESSSPDIAFDIFEEILINCNQLTIGILGTLNISIAEAMQANCMIDKDLVLIIGFTANPELNVIELKFMEQSAYADEQIRYKSELVDRLIGFSKITHEFKSPLLSIDILASKASSELDIYNKIVKARMGISNLLPINGNGVNNHDPFTINCNSDFTRSNMNLLLLEENDCDLAHNLRMACSNFQDLKETYGDIVSDMRKIKDLCHFVLILFKDIEYMTKSIKEKENDSLKHIKNPDLFFFNTSVDLNEVFNFAFNILETKNILSSKDIKISRYFDKALPKWLLTDEIRLKQVLINLITNSIKFTKHGEICLSFENYVDTKERRKFVKFVVRDTGKGMTKVKCDTIISSNDCFTDNIKDLSKENQMGTGLGLAIVKDIIHKIGQDFKVESKVDEGTIISFLINYHDESSKSKLNDIENNEVFNSSEDDSDDPQPIIPNTLVVPPKIQDAYQISAMNQNIEENSLEVDDSRDFCERFSYLSSRICRREKFEIIKRTDYLKKPDMHIPNKKQSFDDSNKAKENNKLSDERDQNCLIKSDSSLSNCNSQNDTQTIADYQFLLKTDFHNYKSLSKELFVEPSSDVRPDFFPRKLKFFAPRKSNSTSVLMAHNSSKMLMIGEAERQLNRFDKAGKPRKILSKFNSFKGNKQCCDKSNSTNLVTRFFKKQIIEKHNGLESISNSLPRIEEVPKPISILVIDDEVNIRNCYKKSILDYAKSKNIKVNVEVAINGLQGMAQIFRNFSTPYNAIILDLNMDYLKGNEIAYIVKSNKDNLELRKTKIFLATAESETQHLLQLNNIRVIDDVLSKCHIKNDVQKVFKNLNI